MTQATKPPRAYRSAKFAKAYAAAWTVLAAIALIYIVTVTVRPAFLSEMLALDIEAEPAPAAAVNQGQSQAVARFATDIGGLKSTVGEIQQSVSALRSTVDAIAVRDKDTADRLARLEEQARPHVAEAPKEAPKTAAQKQAEARAQRAAERAAKAAAASAAAPSPPVTMLNAKPEPAASPISTGSLQQAPAAADLPAPPPAATPPSFGPGAVKVSPAPQPMAVELSSGPSLDALRLNWSLLSDRHPAALKNLEARYTNAGEGQPYQLVAGPLGSPEEAARVCAQLKAKQVGCRITGFGGNAL